MFPQDLSKKLFMKPKNILSFDSYDTGPIGKLSKFKKNVRNCTLIFSWKKLLYAIRKKGIDIE